MYDTPESSPSGFRNGQRASHSGGAPVLVKRAIHERIQNITPLKGMDMCSVRQYAGSSICGYHPTNSSKKNQDSLIMAEDPETGSLLFVCLDGHGVHGDRVSQFVKHEIETKLFSHPEFATDIKTAIRQVLYDLERELSMIDGHCGEFSGTTLSMAVIRGTSLVIANVGDSRIVIAKHNSDSDNLIDMRRRMRTDSLSTGGSFDSVTSNADTDVEQLSLSISDISTRSKDDATRCQSSTLKTSSTSLASCCDEDSTSEALSRSRKRSRTNLSAEVLTIDHKPDLLHEYSRITSAGGRVFSVRYSDGVVGPPRVWLGQANVPGLAMSRSIGDFVVHTAGVVSTPDISEMELDSDADCMLIVATDGLWDQVSNSEAVNIAANHGEASDAVAALIGEARRRWLEHDRNVDDITVCVVYLQGF